MESERKDQEMSTRRMLLRMLKTRGALTVSDMAKELGVTEMAVRRHIHTLERDGLLGSRLIRQSMGRPTHQYFLTPMADELFPKNYHHLTLDLLQELEAEEGPGIAGRLFDLRKRKLLGKYRERMEGKTFEGKVAELADIQNANGYMVELMQEQDGSYVLNEFNCPISQVANQYHDACRCELDLFRELIGAEVERTECLTKGGSKCSYVLRKQ